MLMESEPHKATGLNGLQAKFLIDSAKSIKKTLTQLICQLFLGYFRKRNEKN